MAPGSEGGVGNRRRAVALLGVGAVAGLVLAVHGLIASDPRRGDALPERVGERAGQLGGRQQPARRLEHPVTEQRGHQADERAAADAPRRHVADDAGFHVVADKMIFAGPQLNLGGVGAWGHHVSDRVLPIPLSPVQAHRRVPQ